MENQQDFSKYSRGLVKEVLSGDTVVVWEISQTSQGPPAEKQITLSGIQAPMLGRPKFQTKAATNDQPFAWESREFLRKKLIGKLVYFLVTGTSPNGRSFGVVQPKDEEEDLLKSIVSEGWVKVNRPAAGKTLRDDLQELVNLEDEAKQVEKGIWTQVKERTKKAVRKSDNEPNVIEFYNKNSKSFKAIVERVSTGSQYRLTVLPNLESIQVTLAGITAPGFNKSSNPEDQEKVAEPFAKESKYFVESHVLQREVDVSLQGHDRFNLSVVISYNGRSVGEELLKLGLAQTNDTVSSLPADLANTLKNSESVAKKSKLRVWIHSQNNKSETPVSANSFSGKVVEVLTAGSLVVADPNDVKKVVFLSSVKVPRMGKARESLDPKDNPGKSAEELNALRAERSWAFGGKEFLRKKLIGKKVDVHLDFIKPPHFEHEEKKIYGHYTSRKIKHCRGIIETRTWLGS